MASLVEGGSRRPMVRLSPSLSLSFCLLLVFVAVAEKGVLPEKKQD